MTVIAIDGPAASGKSTIGFLLSKDLNILYLDTGVMYRAVTWAALERSIDIHDESAVSELAETLQIDILSSHISDGRQTTILADNHDVTWSIREPAVDRSVSLVSSYQRVRTVLTEQQRQIACKSVVMVGRDIGTVVLPNADLKLFIQASATERARRRYKEFNKEETPADYEKILSALIERDKQDEQKPISPLIPADDAVVIDTDGLSIEAVLSQVKGLLLNRGAVDSG